MNSVFFGDLEGKVISANEREIKIVVPEKARNCNVVIVRGDSRSNLFEFYVLPCLGLQLVPQELYIGGSAVISVNVYGSVKPSLNAMKMTNSVRV